MNDILSLPQPFRLVTKQLTERKKKRGTIIKKKRKKKEKEEKPQRGKTKIDRRGYCANAST